jgi:hypothetical protein
MFGKHSNKRFSSIVLILSVSLLFVSILYFSQQVRYSNEKEYLTKELDNTNMHSYQVQVEDPLRFLLNYLTVRPAEEVEWEEQLIQKTTSIFLELDSGITNLATPSLVGIPDDTLTELQNLKGNIETILSSLQSEQPLDMKTKEGIMNFTQSVDTCVQFADSQSWERITSDMECLNEEIIISDNK